MARAHRPPTLKRDRPGAPFDGDAFTIGWMVHPDDEPMPDLEAYARWRALAARVARAEASLAAARAVPVAVADSGPGLRAETHARQVRWRERDLGTLLEALGSSGDADVVNERLLARALDQHLVPIVNALYAIGTGDDATRKAAALSLDFHLAALGAASDRAVLRPATRDALKTADGVLRRARAGLAKVAGPVTLRTACEVAATLLTMTAATIHRRVGSGFGRKTPRHVRAVSPRYRKQTRAVSQR